MAHEGSSGSEFRPYISPNQDIPEFTLKAVLLGIFFGVLFGAATVYLALRAGLTVSASVPIAVLSIAVFKKLGNSTILENNMVQTIGSAGESVAAGVVFTMPALLFLADGEMYFKYVTIFVLSAVGGILGVLFMIPLRRALIVKEHGNLKYPEGVACADVLIAGEKGGDLAKMVFKGVGAAMLYKFLYGILGLWRETATWFRTGKDGKIPDATLSCDVTPEYLGLGYIIGPRIAGELASGGVLSWLALIPADLDLRGRGAHRPGPEEPGLQRRLDGGPFPRRVDLPRLRALHRRRRGGVRGRDDAHQDAADDRLGVPRVGEVVRQGRQGGGARSAPSAIWAWASSSSARSSSRSSSRCCRAFRTARSRAR